MPVEPATCLVLEGPYRTKYGAIRMTPEMVQHIGLQCEDLRGQVLSHYDREGVPGEIVHHAPSHSVCLRFIDPYGDTVFNQLQLPVLIAEPEEMARRSSSAELGGRLGRVVAFLVSCEGAHQYVRFMGD